MRKYCLRLSHHPLCSGGGCYIRPHIHQDADLGYGWSERGQRFWVHSTSPGLAAKRSFYGLYFYNEGQVRLWPYPRANGEHTIEVLQRLRAEVSDRKLILLWDGASYHPTAVTHWPKDFSAFEQNFVRNVSGQ